MFTDIATVAKVSALVEAVFWLMVFYEGYHLGKLHLHFDEPWYLGIFVYPISAILLDAILLIVWPVWVVPPVIANLNLK